MHLFCTREEFYEIRPKGWMEWETGSFLISQSAGMEDGDSLNFQSGLGDKFGACERIKILCKGEESYVME